MNRCAALATVFTTHSTFLVLTLSSAGSALVAAFATALVGRDGRALAQLPLEALELLLRVGQLASEAS